LSEQGFMIVIFTNQGGVAIGKCMPADLKRKFIDIQKKVGVDMYFFAASGNSKDPNNKMRKPTTGLFDLAKQLLKIDSVDMDQSFYCGDAAGRRNDHTNDDILFSINIGLKFYTPEMLFENKPIDFKVVSGVKLDKKYQKEEKKVDSIMDSLQIEMFK